MHKAYIVGGNPPTIRNITEHLIAAGIEVSGSALSTTDIQIPKETTFVLWLKNMASHGMGSKINELCSKSRMRIITGDAFSWVKNEAKLKAAGIVPKEQQVPANGAPGAAQAPADAEPVVTDTGPVGETKAVPTIVANNNRHIERSKRIRAAVQLVCERHKDELKTFTDVQLAEEVKAETGEDVGASTCGRWRNELKFARPPAGFKRPRAARPAPKPRSAGAVATTTVGREVYTPVSNADAELDGILDLLKNWAKTSNVRKLYIAFDKTQPQQWQGNCEREVVQAFDLKM